MDSTTFSGAYLAGVDMSGSAALGAIFSGAVLDGVSFVGANLTRDPTSTARTDFTGTFLGGTDFTNATATAGVFSSAYVDFTESGNCTYYYLPGTHTHFAGFWGTPGDPVCVLFGYTSPTIPPLTDSSNSCPGGGPGPCSNLQWQSPVIPMSDAPLPASRGCADTPVCSNIDFNW